MAIKIVRPYYAYLRVTEYIAVMLLTIKIGAKYKLEDLHLGKSYGELDALKQRFESVKVYMRKHAAIALLDALDHERDTLVDAFRNVVKALRHVTLATKQPHVELLGRLLDGHHAETISSASRTSETERLVMLRNAITDDEKAKEAIAALGVNDVASRLFAANDEYADLFARYIAETGAEEKIDTVALRHDGNKALAQFFDAIEYCAYEYGDAEYAPLANEINRLNGYYDAQIKARITRNKNRDKTGDNTPDDPPIVPPVELGGEPDQA